ncbi:MULTISPECIES: bifunctional 2-polyprenyl-6-hydroxyphenol methylase/3-demethylubiquinol 3-O-methyltransferase UbiG [unclassified Streptomyces]|uniref:class I SAM-dependent methyltransferase n=1 Tax=unclassified Streptomyces TaxID=2593676 RepID=UPI000DD9FB0B|nr:MULTISPECIES: class I SAM-dependent methyltransferase [unclassified Streptomyces]QZZ30297.1 methyltransferase domain-containing protein [Streptomyces sp. ST1015]
MASPEVTPEILKFYGETVTEADRLTETATGWLEMVRTRELLRRYLPPAPARVLDVGGGPGTHARWLVEDGYEVHLVDPVPRHVVQAEGSGATVELGDARALTATDGSYDVVLLLGPLYHLVEYDDRVRALAEARRVLRPGGILAAAGINRYASLFEHAAFAHLHRPALRESIDGILRGQIHDGKKAFTSAYFHSGEQLRDEVAGAGFAEAEVFGIEGPAWSMLAAAERNTGGGFRDTALFDSVLEAARMAEPYPDLLAAGSHLLAIGRRPAHTLGA